MTVSDDKIHISLLILRRGALSTSTSLVAFSSLGSRLILTLFWSEAQSSWTRFLKQMFSTLPSQGIFMQMKSESFIYIKHCIVLHQILHLIWNKCYEAIRRGRPRRPSGPIQLPWAQLTPSQQPLPRMRASGYQNTQFEGIFLGAGFNKFSRATWYQLSFENCKNTDSSFILFFWLCPATCPAPVFDAQANKLVKVEKCRWN